MEEVAKPLLLFIRFADTGESRSANCCIRSPENFSQKTIQGDKENMADITMNYLPPISKNVTVTVVEGFFLGWRTTDPSSRGFFLKLGICCQ